MSTPALPEKAVPTNARQLIETLSRSKLYRRYERTFNAATDMPLALRPVDFLGLPFRGKKNENPLCAFLGGTKEWCAAYLQAHDACNVPEGDHLCSIRLPFGLTETSVPVRVGDEVIGFLCTGQVFTGRPKIAAFNKSFRALFGSNPALRKKALALWQKTPFVAAARYEATTKLLSFFGRQISVMSNQIVVEQESGEPPVIAKARRFIADNKTETLSLGRVARAAGASMFHFCKLFHRATGLRFTEYVARVRIEEARARLLNRNMRVSEIAYDVGFQSLTQFNRTFHRVFGQSPSEYRAHLPTTGMARG